MGCCGRNRTTQTTTTRPAATAAPRASTSPFPSFQYIGGSGLTVQGPVSKRVYRFAAPGAIVAVDARDAPSLARVPQLRRA
jgi:hypothetical protein